MGGPSKAVLKTAIPKSAKVISRILQMLVNRITPRVIFQIKIHVVNVKNFAGI